MTKNLQLKHVSLVRYLTDEEAETEIRDLISDYHAEGKNGMNIINIYIKLNLPFEQINKIMSKLEKEGIVQESD